MNAAPLVSIVLPVFNQEKHIAKAIQNVQSQSYKNIEVVIVNDGSTDRSEELIRQSLNDRRVVLVNQPNAGLISASATGVMNAKGEYVCFYDPDDVIGEDYIASFMRELRGNEDFLAMGFAYRYDSGDVPFPLSGDAEYGLASLRELSTKFVLDEDLRLDNRVFVARWNKMYRRECLLSFLQEYIKCSDVSLGEDTIFTYLLLSNARMGRACKQVCQYYYVQHEDSMMHNASWDKAVEKSRAVFEALAGLLERDSHSAELALVLYFALLSGQLSRTIEKDWREGRIMYKALLKDSIYIDALKCAQRLSRNRSINVTLQIERCPATLYLFARRIYKLIK